MEHPQRKRIRLPEYDYSAPGVYFLTVCVKGKRPLLWESVGAAISRPTPPPLSPLGRIVERGIRQIGDHYDDVTVDIYSIMPDHFHMLLRLESGGRQIAAPTVPQIVGQLKRWVSRQVGEPIWQKSFMDRIIRNEAGYRAAWEYIENNPYRREPSVS